MVAGMNISHAPEEGALFGHGIIDSRPVDDGCAQASENGDHDNNRDKKSYGRSEKLCGCQFTYPGHSFHLVHRKGRDISP